MNARLRFSVIIPAHNAAGTIRDAVGSVLEQGRADTEVIVVDDASTDLTASIAQDIADSSPSVRLIRQDRNAGVSAARNAGVAASSGEIIVFLDSDDVHLPGFLATADSAIQGPVDAVVMGRRVITGGSAREVPPGAPGDRPGPDAARETMRDQLTPFPWDKAFRRELLGTSPFPEGVARFEDLASVIIFFSRARTVRVIAEPVIDYRVSGGSLTWGRTPTRDERDAALAHVRSGLDAQLASAARADLRALRVLLTVLIAQAAALRRTSAGAPRSEDPAALLRQCREDLPLRDILGALRRNPAAGAAALLLKLSPALFSRAISWRVSRRYGESATAVS